MLLLLACSDYQIDGKDSPNPFEDPDSDTFMPDTQEDSEVPAEECNGLDDDGDGAVDEDFADVDADGAADCVDTTCDLTLVAAESVALSDGCSGTATVTDPWTTAATNVWTGLSTDASINSVAQTPIVMQLTDDDGDGDVDGDDNVDVVFQAWANAGPGSAHLVVVEAGTWAEELDLAGFYYGADIAAGDIDGDGAPELLGFDQANTVHAYEVDGTEIWSIGPLTDYIGGQPAVAIVDLDGDGEAEVLAQELILDGKTGAELGSLPARGFTYTQHVAADLDLDGTAEIVYDGDVLSADGTLLWSGLKAGMGGMVHAMVLDVDADPEGEVVMAESGDLVMYDTDGSELTRTTFGGGYASIPCAADFDGDGAVEIVVPAQTALHVFDLDGTETMAIPIQDTSTNAGCVGADLDGDGAVELIYADEVAFYVFDARTGSTLVTYTEHASGTLNETPAVADLDGDGSAEVLLTTNENMGRDVWIGLTVIEHAGAGWAPGPSDWPANARVSGRFDASGVVVDVGTWWGAENTFRAVGSTGVPLVRDARVRIDDLCVASCEAAGALRVAVQVANPGREVLPADVEVVLYRVDSGTRTELARQTLGVELASGEAAASLVFEITTGDFGSEGLVATVGEGASDCHPEDNEDAWGDAVGCP